MEQDANDQPAKQPLVLRPSKLGAIVASTEVEDNEEATSGPFSRGLGKRQIKPSFKMKDSSIFTSPKAKASVSETEDASTVPSPTKAVIIRESKLVLNQKLLERLRKPAQQVEFYQAIQRSMQSADKTPPKLVQGSSMINPGDLSPSFFCIHLHCQGSFFKQHGYAKKGYSHTRPENG